MSLGGKCSWILATKGYIPRMGETFITGRIYKGSSYGAQHPLAIPRVPVATDLVQSLDWLPSHQRRISPMAKPAALERFHTAAYVAALQAAELAQFVSKDVRVRHGLGTLSNPVFPEMFRRPATAVGGGMLAAELVLQGGIAFNPGGGQHHGLADAASGFCYFNEPVLTIKHLLAHGLTRIAYVDLDAHHGDGVELAFAHDPRIRMVSVHESKRWPFTGALNDDAGGVAWNLPVARGFADDGFDYALDQLILPVIETFKPEAVFVQCGVDALSEDPLSRLAISNGCYPRAIAALRKITPRMIVSGGGGYNPWTVGRAWTLIWAEIAGYDIPDRLPLHAQAILKALSWNRRARPNPALFETLRDVRRPGGLTDDLRQDVAQLRGRL
jgi:acetoin utilization protein AcuC